MNNIVSLVTDLKVVDSPQAGIGIAKALKSVGAYVIGADYIPFITHNEKLFDEIYCWEEIKNLNLDQLINKINDLVKIKKLNYIFPCYDETAILFAFLVKKGVIDPGVTCVVPPLATLNAIKKAKLSDLIEGDDNIFSTPQYQVVNSMNEALDEAEKVGYPVVVKGMVKGAYYCEGAGDLEYNISKLSKIWNGGKINAIVQKYIKGQFINCAVAFKNNRVVAYAEMKKHGIDQNGATWLGKITKSQVLLSLATKLADKLDFGTSIIEIETIEENGIYFVYEINPRPPAWLDATLFVNLNFADAITNNEANTIKLVHDEGYFGRESAHFFLQNVNFDGQAIMAFSKGAAYKDEVTRYPSDLFLS